MTSATWSTAALVRVVIVVLAVAQLLVACSPPPSVEVARAVRATLDQGVTFRLTAAADSEAIAALGDDAEDVAAALRGFAVLGQRGDAGTVVGVQVLGGIRLLELVTLPDGEVFLRTDVQGVVGEDLEQLLDDLRGSGAPEPVVQGVRALFDRRWVGVTGEAGFAGLLDGVLPRRGDTASEAESAAALDGDVVDAVVRTLVDAAAVGEAQDMVGNARRYPITFDAAEVEAGLDAAVESVARVPFLAALLAALGAGAAEGDVVVSDGVVVSISLRLVAGDAGAGRLELTLDLDDHGDVPPVTAPAEATRVTAQDLADALVALLESGQGN